MTSERVAAEIPSMKRIVTVTVEKVTRLIVVQRPAQPSNRATQLPKKEKP